MTRKLLPLAIGLALSPAGFAQTQSNPDMPARPPPVDPSIPVTYVGSNLRVSLGVDQDGDVLGEILGILGKTDDHAWLGQLWLGKGGAGGVQIDYHWLHGSADDAGDAASVWKVFGAGDQNEWKDRKATLGLGWEKQDFTIDGYYSHSISGSHLTNTTTDTTTSTINGSDAGGAYTQTQTIETLTNFYEHPYENGVGVRIGKYFDDPLLRVRGGLDYEPAAYSSDQVTLSLGHRQVFRQYRFQSFAAGRSTAQGRRFRDRQERHARLAVAALRVRPIIPSRASRTRWCRSTGKCPTRPRRRRSRRR